MTAVEPMPSATKVVDLLARGRELVEPSLRQAISRLDEHTRLVASYHLGWCDVHGRPASGSSGKAIRPGLTLLVAEAVAGTPDPGVPGGVAVELVHNFSLIHDDLMDRDTQRRHRRTVWAIWGDATAVLVGDALACLADEVLGECNSPYAPQAGHALAVATRELIRGQVLDVAFEQRSDVSLAECVDMAVGKTGALLGASAQLGAILAGADPATCEAFRRYGRELGLAFQLVDDLLGIWGAPEKTGKPVFADLLAHKKTLPVVWSLEYGGSPGQELAAWFADPEAPTADDLQCAAVLVERAGGREWAMAEAEERVRRAGKALDGAGVQSANREQLDQLAQFVAERQL
ncbi:polyprenyl synthetase family protein [Kribbella solani]|uniref:polyprenyl synthetase family protein n=1 Tax=Kribbella solani TaxID=236067 RepID=UPI0029A2995C|nr:polyprenyl synthetase family protein [Kribbella solani]MDX2974097.1 polyprenyl synthetase family protein [Kribbella solani]MDX3006203.1 polyprenyl synthetase family protein [Kribbella solani]